MNKEWLFTHEKYSDDRELLLDQALDCVVPTRAAARVTYGCLGKLFAVEVSTGGIQLQVTNEVLQTMYES